MRLHFFSYSSCIGNVRVRAYRKEWEICVSVYIVENKKVYKNRYSKSLVLETEVTKRW
jgi:hypothetical protein